MALPAIKVSCNTNLSLFFLSGEALEDDTTINHFLPAVAGHSGSLGDLELTNYTIIFICCVASGWDQIRSDFAGKVAGGRFSGETKFKPMPFKPYVGH